MNIDERLEFLMRSSEYLHASVQELHAVASEHTRQLEIAPKIFAHSRILPPRTAQGLII